VLSRYDIRVDPGSPNNAHAFAVDLVGWNRRVLELGAASGHVTRALVAQRCRVTAIEYEAESARELEGVAAEVIVGDLNDPGIFDGLGAEFDTVLAGDVLEHLLHPHEVLRRAAQLLRPGGQVVVSLPNVGHVDVRLSLMQGDWDYRPWGLMDDTHIRFFTLKNIKALVAEAGLVITDLRRVRIPAFETELRIDRATVPTEMIEFVLADAEAETYQFVFSAVTDRGDVQLGRVAEQNLALTRELARLRIAHGALRSENELVLATTAQRLAESAQHHEQAVSSLQAQIGSLRAELDTASRFVRRVDGSVCWQSFQAVRGGLYALLGGDRSPLARAVQAMLRLAGGGLFRNGGVPKA
jgi:2-polyprenyl-3-methyl-5-hydroxy-6-metoxy-1,4-benzoquinol methylase